MGFDLSRRDQNAVRRQGRTRTRLVQGARVLRRADVASGVVSDADPGEAGPALRTALSGTPAAHRARIGQSPARAENALVGRAALRIYRAAGMGQRPGPL